MNTANIYLLQNAKGQYVSYNKIHGYSFCFKIHDAQYTRKKEEAEASKPKIEQLLNIKLEIVKSTEQELLFSYGLTATHAVITGSYFIEFLELINYNIPTISQVNKNIKKHLVNAINSLKPIDVKFKDFESVKDDQTYEVYGYYQEMIHELAKIDLYHCNNITQLLKAYQKSPKSLEGITKKILNN